MQRRLPIYFLIDVSESMAGDELYQLDEALDTIITTLRKDPYALETAFVSVIVFAGKPKTVVPLTELIGFSQPELPVGGGTGLGAALDHLMSSIDRDVVKGTSDSKGDWKPVVFLLTDGHPTDDVRASVNRWNSNYRSRANLVAVSIGGKADHRTLAQLTEDVIVFFDSAPEAFARFAKWVSVSIVAQSRSVHAGTDAGAQLAPAEVGLVERVDVSKREGGPAESIDERYAIVIGRCEQSGHPYLLKYAKDPEAIAQIGLPAGMHPSFIFKVSMPLRASYFELSSDAGTGSSIDLNELLGQPPCPHCGAEYSMALCGNCHNIHCVGGPGSYICPWCKGTAEYGFGGDGDFRANRGRG